MIKAKVLQNDTIPAALVGTFQRVLCILLQNRFVCSDDRTDLFLLKIDCRSQSL
jgi:hypothetical protein